MTAISPASECWPRCSSPPIRMPAPMPTAERDEDAGVVALGGALPVLAENGQLDVVLHHHGGFEQLLEVGPRRQVLEAAEARHQSHDRAPLAIHGARQPGGNGQQSPSPCPGGGREQGPDLAAQPREEPLRPAVAGRPGLARRERLPGQVRDGQPSRRGIEHDAGHDSVLRIELDRAGRAPSGGRASPELVEEAQLQELARQAPHRRGREAGGGRDLGSGQGARMAHRGRQHAIPVDAAKLPRMPRFRVGNRLGPHPVVPGSRV